MSHPLSFPRAPGRTWRSARPDDTDRLAAFSTLVHEAETLHDIWGPETYRYWLSFPGMDLERDTLLALDSADAVRAMVFVLHQHTPKRSRSFFFFETHPDETQLRPFLVSWAEAAALETMAANTSAGARRLRTHIEDHRTPVQQVLEAAGFHHARTFVEMRRGLAEPVAAPDPPPSGIRIVPWSAGFDPSAVAASNAAFASHWDSMPMTLEDWRKRHTDDDIFRPDLSFLAVEGERVVALCICSIDPEYTDQTGREELWVDRLGTVPDQQRRGLGTTLLVHAMRAAAAVGLDQAGLDVDAASNTNATALYERVGFAVDHRAFAYVKDYE